MIGYTYIINVYVVITQNILCFGEGYLLFFFFFFVFLMAAPAAYGSSQARGQIGAVGYPPTPQDSNNRSEPRLRLNTTAHSNTGSLTH